MDADLDVLTKLARRVQEHGQELERRVMQDKLGDVKFLFLYDASCFKGRLYRFLSKVAPGHAIWKVLESPIDELHEPETTEEADMFLGIYLLRTKRASCVQLILLVDKLLVQGFVEAVLAHCDGIFALLQSCEEVLDLHVDSWPVQFRTEINRITEDSDDGHSLDPVNVLKAHRDRMPPTLVSLYELRLRQQR